MINIINYYNESSELPLVPLIEDSYLSATKLLDKLPKSIDIKFTDNGASEHTGVGGFAVSEKQINIAVLKDFDDRKVQRRNLRGTVFHEAFHIQQGFTYNKSPFTALESALYEGCAVIFEQMYADHPVAYADYSQHTDGELKKWLREIRLIGTEYFEDTDIWHTWAFHHPDYDQKWIIYKVGTWLITNILKESNLDILALKNMPANEIAKLAPF